VYEEDDEKVQHKNLLFFFCIKSTKLKLILHTINMMKFLKRMIEDVGKEHIHMQQKRKMKNNNKNRRQTLQFLLPRSFYL